MKCFRFREDVFNRVIEDEIGGSREVVVPKDMRMQIM